MNIKTIPGWQAVRAGILTGIVLNTMFYSWLFGTRNLVYVLAFRCCTIPEILFSVTGTRTGKYRNENWVSVWVGSIRGTLIGLALVYLVLTNIPLS